jgi:hypothetical protein
VRAGLRPIERPSVWVSALFLVFALPTIVLPLFARDYYHLERAHEYALAQFWKADDFQFREYFWWPFDGYYCRFFRPLWSGAVALMYRVFGLSPVPYRIWWLVLHLASIALFDRVLRRSDLSPRARLIALAIYAVHPFWCAFALEPIAVGSANAMVMVIVFGSLLAFMRWRDEGWRPGYGLAFAGVLLGLATKEIGVFIAPLFAAYDYFIPGPRREGLVRRHMAWCGVVAVYLVFYVFVVSRHNHLRPPYYLTWETPGFGRRMLHQIGLYLAQPLVIGLYHPLANTETYMERTPLFVALVVFALGAYFFVLRRTWRLPWARFAAAFLLLSIIPVLPVIVQFQEFAPGAAAVGILVALGIDRSVDRWRTLVEAAVLSYYAGALVIALIVSAAISCEADATLVALEREVPAVVPDTQLYFINTSEYAWLGEASLLRLRYREPTLNVQHLSFDCGELPPNPRTALGRMLTGLLAAFAPERVRACDPVLRTTSDRSFVLTLGGRAFFDSDLGRFVLQGRGPFLAEELSRHGAFEARIDAVENGLPTQMSFRWDAPLASPTRVFVRWEGTNPRVVRF